MELVLSLDYYLCTLPKGLKRSENKIIVHMFYDFMTGTSGVVLVIQLLGGQV